ncbi:MAG TPA: hypothetical protein VH299_03795 [Solirubrobacterales bacterium]|jgi:hypothetical protein|nr:hypothetical protein [Solirubrobacterales bacterium]
MRVDDGFSGQTVGTCLDGLRRARTRTWNRRLWRPRFVAGADAIEQAEGQIAKFQAEIDAHRDLSSSLALDGAGS